MLRLLYFLLALALVACRTRSPESGAEDALPDTIRPEMREIVANARLWAKFTRPGIGVWPHEAWDSIFTVREPVAGTGYKPAAGENALRVDVQPWLGGEIVLDSISWLWDKEWPKSVEVFLGQGCGLPPTERIPWPEPSVPLRLFGKRAGCVEVRFLSDGTGIVKALSVLSNDEGVEPPSPNITATPIRYPRYGVIEGFYGLPWSWRERSKMVKTMAAFGLGIYLYAPKNDPLHREKWREPYTEADLQRFQTWNEEARALGVKIFFGISPFIDGRFDNEADYAALISKFLDFFNIGFRGFALLADDIEFETEVSIDEVLGQKHAEVVNRVLTDLRGLDQKTEMIFVPTVYSNERLAQWPGGRGYLFALRDLHQDVEVMWTGKGTSCATMDSEDVRQFREIVGRKPLIWDNFYANDGGDMFMGRVLLAPFSGREQAFLEDVSGIALNLSIQGALSRLSLGTFAAWLEDPSRKDQIEVAIRMEQAFSLNGDRRYDLEALRLLMEAYEGKATDPYPAFVALEKLIKDLKATLEQGGLPLESSTKMLSLLARLWALPSDLYHSGLDVDLVDDAWFPAEKARAEAEIGLWTLALLGERMAGREGLQALEMAGKARQASFSNRFMFGPASLGNLLDVVAALPPVSKGFEPPVRTLMSVPECRVGEPVSWKGWSKALKVEVAGLPQASVAKDGTVTWTPLHAGVYEAVAIAVGASGWDFLFLEWPCRSEN